MTEVGTVLVVDEGDAEPISERLESRGLDVAVAADIESAVATSGENCCVVCGQLAGHTVAELVTRLDRRVGPVVFVYEDVESATTALDAGAAATIPRDDPDTDWGAHLAATVDSIRRRSTAQADAADDSLLPTAIDELPDVFFVVSVNGTFLRWNDKLVETTRYTDAEVAEMRPTDFFEGEDETRIENAIGRVVMNGRATEVADLVTKDGRTVPHEFTGALIDADGTQAIVGTARDVRERRERERELERQAERLEAVNHVNALIRDVVAGLLAAETREAIAQTVCESLTAADAYRFAWVGSYDGTTGEVSPDAWAGEGEGYLDDRPTGQPDGSDRTGNGEGAADDGAADEGVTALTAVREGRVVFAQDVSDDPEASAWRAQALEYGHRSGAAIPVRYGDSTYGCLCLYAARPNAFGPLEREVLAELGEIVGHAIHAAETRRALTADTVTELQFQVTDESSFLVQAAAYTDAELALVGSIDQPDGAIVHLFTVSKVAPDVVEQFADAAPMPAELVTEREGESVVKVTVEGYSLSHALAEVGGTVRSIAVVDGEVRVRADVPRDVDVATVLEKLREVYDVQLLSQRAVERNDRTDVDFRADVERHLTARQREVLETALRAGFFDWPREQNGQAVADLLDVSPPTYHQHLRVGLRKLLEVMFDHGPPDGADVGTRRVDDADLSEVAETTEPERPDGE